MKPWNIVLLNTQLLNPGDLSWAALEELGDVRVYNHIAGASKEDVIRYIGDGEIVVASGWFARIDEPILDACPNIKYIGLTATGYNSANLTATRERGIPICNVPDYGTQSVAQFAIALLLEICSRVGHHDREVHSGRWARGKEACFWDYPLMELSGKTMGIIGFGRIGREVGKVAAAFGMRVLANNGHPGPKEDSAAQFVELDTLYAQSDVISLHCPLFAENRGMINRQAIAKMKDGVILINNARGPLIVDEDLAEALNSGKVFAAGLDALSREPLPLDNPLMRAKNCIITPHISWVPREARQRMLNTVVENIKAFSAGRPINVVNGL